MEQPRLPNFQRLAAFTALFILLSAALLFGARDIIRELVVFPLSYLFWLLGVLINYTPQLFFWVVLLLIVLRIAFTSLLRKRKAKQSAPRNIVEPSDLQVNRGRAAFWAARVEMLASREGDYYSRSFHSALGKMLLDLLAYRYRITPKQVEERLKKGALDLPQDVHAYALDSLRPPEGRRGGFFTDLWDQVVSAVRAGISRIKGALSKMNGSENREKAGRAGFSSPMVFKDSVDNARVEREYGRVKRVLEFMEDELEVPHDNSGR